MKLILKCYCIKVAWILVILHENKEIVNKNKNTKWFKACSKRVHVHIKACSFVTIPDEPLTKC